MNWIFFQTVSFWLNPPCPPHLFPLNSIFPTWTSIQAVLEERCWRTRGSTHVSQTAFQVFRGTPLKPAGGCQAGLQRNQAGDITSEVVWESVTVPDNSPEAGKQTIICRSSSNPEQFPTRHCGKFSYSVTHYHHEPLTHSCRPLLCVCVCVSFFKTNSSISLHPPSSGGV